MPFNPASAAPGVYVEEISSGVHPITGVATSITAFLGPALRGPINEAVPIFSFKDYERSFGGLSANSDMSYAVSQFFLNGGSDAYIVRLARGARAASANLLDPNGNVLNVTATDEGAEGNNIQISIGQQNVTDTNNFNLTFSYVSADNPADNITELFQNLSLDPANSRFIEDLVNGISRLVTVAVHLSIPASVPSVPNQLTPAFGGISSGAFTPTELNSLKTFPDATHNSFNIGFNGHPTEVVTIESGTPGDSSSLAAYLADIASRIQNAVQAKEPGKVAWSNFACVSDGTHLILFSGTLSSPGTTSSVRVAAATTNSILAALHLDQTTAISGASLTSTSGGITSGPFAPSELSTLSTLPNATSNSFKIGLDGQNPAAIIIDSTKPGDSSSLAAYLSDIASRIQKVVQSAKPGLLAWRNFICTSDDTHLILSSGTPGTTGSVQVADADTNSIFAALHLDQAVVNLPNIPTLSLGAGDSFADDDPDALEIYSGDQLKRTGIYALDAVDLFNLLCIPAVTEPAIQTMALQYCQSRRAVLIADAPLAPSDLTKPGPQSLKPNEMVAYITGPNLPKGDLGTYAAIYYPRVKVPDLLKGGKLRSFTSSGIIAGLYASTDSARGVWKAPAGTSASLVGVQALDYLLTDGENGELNSLGVNCLRIFPIYGAVSWGARTISGADAIGSEYKYIPVRRTALYIEESLRRGLQWVVFEPNDEPLWAQIRLNVGAFMHDLFRKGAFQGQTPKDAYLVKCDSETTRACEC